MVFCLQTEFLYVYCFTTCLQGEWFLSAEVCRNPSSKVLSTNCQRSGWHQSAPPLGPESWTAGALFAESARSWSELSNWLKEAARKARDEQSWTSQERQGGELGQPSARSRARGGQGRTRYEPPARKDVYRLRSANFGGIDRADFSHHSCISTQFDPPKQGSKCS